MTDVEAQIEKLKALSKSPYEGESKAALKKIKFLKEKYGLNKVKKFYPVFDNYEMRLCCSILDYKKCKCYEKCCYGVAKDITDSFNYTKESTKEIFKSLLMCDKILEGNKKNTIGTYHWYQQGFYEGFCEELNINPCKIIIFARSNLDYGSQLYIQNIAWEHGKNFAKKVKM